MLISQPVVGIPSQSAKPARHAVRRHDPPIHATAALANSRAQSRPHTPQFVGSVAVVAHTSPQRVWFIGQTTRHTGAPPSSGRAQAVPAGQRVPHAPQWSLLVARSTH